MTYYHSSQHANQAYSDSWVKQRIGKYISTSKNSSVLDVGAGLSPYRLAFEELGAKYYSHDFNQYIPSKLSPGLQNSEWIYPKHDFVCDLLEIPTRKKYDFVICTEVLEHVPDPVAVLKKIVNLTNCGGHILITVPFLSLMHQSPFWFSSGLSPFWFEHWSKTLHLEIRDLEVSGDFLDLMEQEFARVLNFSRPIRGLTRVSKSLRILRPYIPVEVLESGGFGTFCVLYKP